MQDTATLIIEAILLVSLSLNEQTFGGIDQDKIRHANEMVIDMIDTMMNR